MSKKMPGAPSASTPAWAKVRPRCVLPIPVAPYTTQSVPGSKPPPSISSSRCRPVVTRAVTEGQFIGATRGGSRAALAFLTGGSRPPYLLRMSSRVVLCSEKSPVAALVALLADDFEKRAIILGRAVPLAADEAAVLLVDVESDAPELLATLGARVHDVPVIALAATPPIEAALPPSWYACLGKPVTRPVLERAPEQAFDPARLPPASAATRL